MKRKSKKIACLLVGAALMITSFSGCGSKTEETSTNAASSDSGDAAASGEPVELKIMLRADKPTGWDEVEAAVEQKMAEDGLNIDLNVTWVPASEYKNKLNLAITSGEEWDLVYDATFLCLKTLAADNYYADLSSYWNNDEYPGLKECFSDTLIENNEFLDQKCVIPLLRTYGSGIPAVHYRQDWADEWGSGTIDSYDKLTEYWDKCLEEEGGIYPLSVTGSRGFYQLLSTYYGLNDVGIQMVSNSGINYYVYIQDNKVQSIAAEGAGDEAFKDFPEPFNYDFGAERYDEFAKWREKGYIETDSLNQSDAKTMFFSGLSASMVGTLDDYEDCVKQMATYSPDAELGEFIYNDDAAAMKEGAFATSYQANNFLAIPESSKKIDTTMKFLNWIFSSEENHDLIELGIEGTDWQDNGDGTYQSLSSYTFPGYILTWTSKYVKFSDSISEDILEYRQYELKDSTFAANLLPGFTLDTSDIQTETAQVKAITDKVSTVKLHGILNDGTTTYDSAEDMLEANLDAAYDAGAQTIEDTIIQQVNDYLANQN